MDATKRALSNRWAIALAALLIADGALANRFGAPDWFAILYFALGLALVAPGVWIGRRRERPAKAAPVPAERAATRAVGYVCVSHRNDLAPHRKAIKRCCAERGLALITIAHDVEPEAGLQARPSLAWALAQLAEGQADVLVVARLRDLSPNVANLTPLLSWFNQRRRLIAVEIGLDTATEAGRLAAIAVAGVGGWERERISGRARAGGQGRTSVADVSARIVAMRKQGMTLQAIADRLNEDGIPTLRGGVMWRPSSVQRITGYRRPSGPARGIERPPEP